MSSLLFSTLNAVLAYDYVPTVHLMFPVSALIAAPSSLLLFAHLIVFGLLLGTMAWVTFISGIVLFKALPRVVFGQVQTALFPHYFRLQTSVTSRRVDEKKGDEMSVRIQMESEDLSFFALIGLVIAERHNITALRSSLIEVALGVDAYGLLLPRLATLLAPFLTLSIHNVQLGLLIAALASSLTQQFIIGPMTTAAMYRRHRAMDAAAAQPKDDALAAAAKSSNRSFGMIHGVSSLLNMQMLIILISHGVYFITNVIRVKKIKL